MTAQMSEVYDANNSDRSDTRRKIVFWEKKNLKEDLKANV